MLLPNRLRVVCAALLLALAVVVPTKIGHAQITPLISAYVGTQTANSNLGYFVLDFNDNTANPEVYAFGYYYTGNPSDADLLILLKNTLTGANGFQETGAENNFVTRLGYNNRVKFNDFAGNNSGEPNGYWNFWLSDNGANWTNSQFGIKDIVFNPTTAQKYSTFTKANETYAAPWHGVRWVSDSTTQSPQAPRTPLAATSAAAPEPATLALLLPFGGLLLLRRRSAK